MNPEQHMYLIWLSGTENILVMVTDRAIYHYFPNPHAHSSKWHASWLLVNKDEVEAGHIQDAYHTTFFTTYNKQVSLQDYKFWYTDMPR